MFAQMLKNAGLRSGVVYASGLMTAGEVIRMAADFRSQESIEPTTRKVLQTSGLNSNELTGRKVIGCEKGTC